MRASTLSRPEVPLQAELPAELPNTLNAESSAEDLEIGRVENMRLFADDEWLPLPHLKFRLLLTSISPRRPLSILHCRRRNSLLVLSVMFVSLHFSRPLSLVPSPCRHSRVSLPCRCHSRSHPLLTLPSFVLFESIYPRISHQSGRKHEFSFQLRVVQS